MYLNEKFLSMWSDLSSVSCSNKFLNFFPILAIKFQTLIEKVLPRMNLSCYSWVHLPFVLGSFFLGDVIWIFLIEFELYNYFKIFLSKILRYELYYCKIRKISLSVVMLVTVEGRVCDNDVHPLVYPMLVRRACHYSWLFVLQVIVFLCFMLLGSNH